MKDSTSSSILRREYSSSIPRRKYKDQRKQKIDDWVCLDVVSQAKINQSKGSLRFSEISVSSFQ